MSRQQLLRWARSLSTGLGEGLGGPGLCLAIQAQLPARTPGAPATASTGPSPERSTRPAGVGPLMGVQA